VGLKSPLIPFGISGPPTPGGFRTPLGFWQGGGSGAPPVIPGAVAVPEATEGLFCVANVGAATSFATMGLFCDVDVVPPIVEPPRVDRGGGSKKSRRQVPGITSTRAIAFREDEELLAMLEAYFNTKRH